MVVWYCAKANTKPRFQSADDAEYCWYVTLSASAGLATNTSTAHNSGESFATPNPSFTGLFSPGAAKMSDRAPVFNLDGATPSPSAAAAKVWHTLADPEKVADGLDELGDRDRLRQISLATAFADALFIALHRKCRHRNHWNGLQFGVFLEPFGHFETGDLRQLNVHQDQVGAVFAGEIGHLEAIGCADGAVAVGFQQVVEELHIELVVLHDHYCLRHLPPFGKSAHEPRCPAGPVP